MQQGIQSIKAAGDALFSKKMPVLTLWQEMAEQFYVERADFTVTRSLGDEFADHLTTSYPMRARRDLASLFSGVRPAAEQWFFLSSSLPAEEYEAQAWLEWATEQQREFMYADDAGFVRATKEGDNDYVTFGQCAISCEYNNKTQSLLFRNWHLKDMAWSENYSGRVEGNVHRNWRPEARLLASIGRANQSFSVSPAVTELLKENPSAEVNCRHVVIPADEYKGGDHSHKGKFISIHIDCDNDHVMEEVGIEHQYYIIPRWQTISGSQYSYSPSTVSAISDARLMQAMTLTLLEAGENAVRPPMLAVQEAIRDDVALYAGGITWVDAEYDERLGEVLRPISQDTSAIPLGIEMQRDIRDQIHDAFFLNKIGLPELKGDMTAFEAGQRVADYVRAALPLFEPLEQEYNAAICKLAFDILMQEGKFGPVDTIPQILQGEDIKFRFKSPLSEAKDQQKTQKFLNTKSMILEAEELEPGSGAILDTKTALRDVLTSDVSPAAWINSVEDVEEIDAANAAAQAETQAQQETEQMANVAKTASEAASAMPEEILSQLTAEE